MFNTRKLAPFVMALVTAAWSSAALADPPDHAPAHGWRKHHDPDYVGYTGKHWNQDYGILSGHCDRERVATVLGGVVGGVIGSRVGSKDDRTVATIIGAVAGALIGRRIGHDMDAADRSCIGHALEMGKPGQVIAWVNHESGVEYQISLKADRDNDRRCREYTLIGIAGKDKSVRQGTACQDEPGIWNIRAPVRT